MEKLLEIFLSGGVDPVEDSGKDDKYGLDVEYDFATYIAFSEEVPRV